MFDKLVRNLTKKPNTLNQFAFYSSRLKKEKSIRTIGLVFMVLTLLVQIVASAVPAERTFAASNNDIIAGGVATRADLVAKCKSNAQIQAIYAKFGVACANISAGVAQEETISATGANYWSIGRTPLSSNGISSDDWGEVKMSAGGVNIYQRPLKAWGSASYRAFKITVGGKTFWILKDCGNLVTIGPTTPKPGLEVRKQLLSTNTVKPGDTVKFRISYRNPVPESVAIDFRLRDLLNPNLELVGMDGRNDFIGNDPVTNLKGLGDSTAFREVNLVAKVKAGVANGTEICNTARVSADVVGSVDSNKVCVTVVIPAAPQPAPQPTPPTPVTPTPSTPPPPPPPPVTPMCTVPGKTNLPANSPECKIEPPDGFCVASTSFIDKSNKNFKVVTTSSVSGTTKVVKYVYTLDSNSSLDKTAITSDLTDEQIYKDLKPGNHKVQVTVEFTNDSKKSVSKTCSAEINVAEDAKLSQSKTVTRNDENIDGKKVTPNDTLVFKLTTKNITATDYKNFQGEDYFGDVLDYADIVDPNQLSAQGLTLGTDKILRWKTGVIEGNSEDVKVITVKVKPVTPATNRPSNISSDYDCIISNKYGNQVTMSMSCPLVKTIERTSTSLPNTGPGTTVGFAFVITVIGGYFLARARVLAKESDIIKRMYHATGLGV